MKAIATVSGFRPTKEQLQQAEDHDPELVERFLNEGEKIRAFRETLKHLSKRWDRGIRASLGYALREAEATHDALGYEIACIDMPQLRNDDDVPF